MTRSGLLVCVLAGGLLAGCSSGDQASAKKDAAPAATAATPATSAKASPDLLALLPAKNEVAGWDVSRAARGFTADNLWELIDGAADAFINYGVQEVVTADYTQAGSGFQAVVEIYTFKDTLNAYGKYSEERNPDYHFLTVGNEGYSGGTSVNFWSGLYYVKITAFQEKEAIQQEIVKLAQAIAAKVKTPGAEPREVSFFPKENQVAHTTLFIPKDVLAQSYFTNGFESRYKGGAAGKDCKLVIITLDSADAAKDGLTRYRQAVSKDGKGIKDLKAPGDGGFAGIDSYYGNMAAVRAGSRLAVALGAASEDAAKKQLTEVVKNFK